MNNYFNRTVAIDASMTLYQFLIAIRSGPEGEVLHNEAGEVTSHLQGMFYRTIRMLDNGIKPVYVFGQHTVSHCSSPTQMRLVSCSSCQVDYSSCRMQEQMERHPSSSQAR